MPPHPKPRFFIAARAVAEINACIDPPWHSAYKSVKAYSFTSFQFFLSGRTGKRAARTGQPTNTLWHE
jgi:hypothetical protein